MKKQTVGILTFPNSPSFGASLQMLGMFQALKGLGVTPEVINYINPYMKSQKHISRRRSSLFRELLLAINNLPMKEKFRRFEQRVVLYPHKAINDAGELKALADRYDYMICGSDQVWNPLITGNDKSYYFDFCEDNSKKIAYAPSFGVNTLPEDQYAGIADALRSFAAVSVRETRGREIVEEMTGQTCPVVVDPSMLLDRDSWMRLAKKPKNLPDRYIVYFIFNHNEKVRVFADRLSTEKGVPVITLGGGLLSRLKDPRNIGAIGPDEWLYAIANAEYVITDSFHGAAFSIIFERSVVVSMASATNSRLVTLMETFHMEDRVLDDVTFNPDDRTDYAEVEQIMQQKRNEGLAYLRQSLKLEKLI